MAGGWTRGEASGIPASGIPASGIPARNRGTRPPFAPGHALALKGGAFSPRVYLPLARELAAGLLDARPDLAPYGGEVAAWAEWEARAMLMRRHLATVGDLDDDGEPRKGPTTWLLRCEDRAARARASLGLTPFAEAALAKERAAASVLAVDLAAMAERGRQTLAARVASGEWDEPDPAGEVLAAVAAQGSRAQARADAEHSAAEHARTTTHTTTAVVAHYAADDHHDDERAGA
ncbi:hypothetical protein [Intrasporangium sp. DVR]|uniref:hypothetical protein n=1 Tax=Intrasporangium sp. DVR TaxID=3127867 RepID=UPI00313A5D08